MSLRIVEIDGVDIVEDATGVFRLATDGRVIVTPPPAPDGATAVTIAADTPLSVSGLRTTEYTIANGKTFHLQQVQSGAEGDPSEKGNKVEIRYYDGAAEHLVARQYIMGETLWLQMPDVSAARDGTSMDGNGTTKTIRVVRERLGGSSQEIDAVVYGYEE